MIRTSFAVLLASAGLALTAADGPGIGNLDWQALGVKPLETIAVIDKGTGVPRGTGYVTMHRGYLLVMFSNDGGGGAGSGGMAFLDISDPRTPKKVFSTADDPRYAADKPDACGALREAHGFTLWGDILAQTTNKGLVPAPNKKPAAKKDGAVLKSAAGAGDAVPAADGTGIQFWDLADVQAPKKLANLNLPGLDGGDYSNTPWWLAWQGGRYLYVAGTEKGLYIVDASDPRQPRLVDRGGKPNPIPPAELGNFRINVVAVVGNLMALAMTDGKGLSLCDISDPAHPRLLSTVRDPGVGYSMLLNGNRIYGTGGALSKPKPGTPPPADGNSDPGRSGVRIFDISNPAAIPPARIATHTAVGGKGGYGVIQDDTFFYGSSESLGHLGVGGTAEPVLRAEIKLAPPGVSKPDWDFGTPLGNFVYAGNDHGGSAFYIHQQAPDRTGPRVNMVVPADGAAQQAVTSRVGLTFTDQLLCDSLAPATVTVRKKGGTPLAGRYTHQLGMVNFWPDQPLEAKTTYEVVVAKDGVKDLAGNGCAEAFTSSFSTR